MNQYRDIRYDTIYRAIANVTLHYVRVENRHNSSGDISQRHAKPVFSTNMLGHTVVG